ncbi:MAG: class I SAM-dependent methyltransferase [Bacteroidia bacterium]|nr:class I SAM-dependent methyltransferase [Bacteroidia bacterium]
MNPQDRSQLYGYADGSAFAGESAEAIFTRIARSNFWGEPESRSGYGSSLEQTRKLIAELPALWRHLGVQHLLDAPCGDFHWMQHTDLSGIRYTGGDLVAALAEANERQYAAEHIRFRQLDLMEDELGSHDLLFCRDCLVHLSFGDIGRVLRNLKRSGIRYFMCTTFPGEPVNRDIQTGGWRPLNFSLPPFSFPEPLLLLNEGCTEMDGAFADKSLGVWQVSSLP